MQNITEACICSAIKGGCCIPCQGGAWCSGFRMMWVGNTDEALSQRDHL